jgi:ribosomal protein S24E
LSLGLLLTACAPQLRDLQVEHYRSIKAFAGQLVEGGVITPQDRLLVIRTDYRTVMDGDADTHVKTDPTRDQFFEDALVSGLTSHGAGVLQNLVVNPFLARRELEETVTKVAGGTPNLAMVAEWAAKARANDLEVGTPGGHVAVRKVRDALTAFGVTKILIYRWVYHSENGTPGGSGSTKPPVGNRVFVRIVDATSGYVTWSDLLSSPKP